MALTLKEKEHCLCSFVKMKFLILHLDKRKRKKKCEVISAESIK